MIQQFFNGVLTLLLAKFVLNDVPHAILNGPESEQDRIIRALKENVLKDIRWKSTKEAGDVWGQKGESSWAREEWGEVRNGMVTLFHGTSSHALPDILKEGLVVSRFEPPEELGEYVWLAVTPYIAFSYGDICLRVRIPIEWISDVSGSEVWIDRNIPHEMVVEVKSIEDWRRNR